MRKSVLSFLLLISILAIFILPGGVVNAATPTSPSSQQDVPVIFDGKYYQSTESADLVKIVQQKNASGIYLGFIMDAGILYGYSNIDELLNKYGMHLASRNKIANQNAVPAMSQTGTLVIPSGNAPLTLTSGYAYSWINYNESGDSLAAQEGTYVPPAGNLSGEFLNSISCVYYPSGGSSNWNGFALFTGYNQSGNVFIQPKGQAYSNLPTSPINYNDVAKSFEFTTP
jgi:hypothetical protein